MWLSTKARYGLKAVVDLADGYGEGPLSLAKLSALQGVSESYLEQLLRQLKKAGLVRSTRGVNGGYLLTRKPDALSVEEVIEALEGSTAVVDCVDASGGVCPEACTCSARPLFLKLQQRITAVLANTSIQELLADHLEQKRRIEDAKGISG